MEKRETPFTKIVFPLRVKNIELCDEIILTQQKQKVNITKKVTARKERLLVAIQLFKNRFYEIQTTDSDRKKKSAGFFKHV